MLISLSFLKNSYNQFKKNREKNKHSIHNSGKFIREGYNLGETSVAGISASIDIFILAFACLFFILELFLLFYSISLAIKCTKPGPQRIMHITLAITFTLPYALISVFFNKCAQDTLVNSDIFMSSLNINTQGSKVGMAFI